MPILDELNTSIAERKASKMASSSKATRDSYQKGIDVLRRKKQMTIAAMAFVHIMVDKKLQRALTELRTEPEGFAMLFVEQYGGLGCSVLNYCKFKLWRPLWKYKLIFEGVSREREGTAGRGLSGRKPHKRRRRRAEVGRQVVRSTMHSHTCNPGRLVSYHPRLCRTRQKRRGLRYFLEEPLWLLGLRKGFYSPGIHQGPVQYQEKPSRHGQGDPR